MEKIFAQAEELVGNVKAYINARIDEVKFETAEKTSSLLANLIAGTIVAVVFLFCLVFGSIAMAIVLGECMGRAWAGYLAVSFFYFLIGIIVWLARGKLIQLPIMNSLIRQLFKQDEKD